MENIIGNTPMIKIKYKYNNEIKYVYAKLEYYNLTGSIKDRVIKYIMDKAYKEKKLKKFQPIVEATSGNTGISLAALGSLYHNPVYIFMPNWTSKERVKIMEIYGAKVNLISKEDGGFLECIKRANKLSDKLLGFRPNQFENEDNVLAHYHTTALEILNQCNQISGFVSGVGTGGTLIGVAKKLKEINHNIKIIAIEPEQLPIISKGIKIGKHKIEGIGDEFIPKLFNRELVDKIITIDDDDAINMARLLASKLGLGVGISSGANFLGAVLSKIDNIVTVFPDDLKKYLSTDLIKQNNKENLISNQIQLIDYEII